VGICEHVHICEPFPTQHRTRIGGTIPSSLLGVRLLVFALGTNASRPGKQDVPENADEVKMKM
jgi:hypothetical protein